MRIGFAFFHDVHKICQRHAQELGVHEAVTNTGWAGGFAEHVHPWDYMPLLKTKLSMNQFGMDFSVFEGVNFIDGVKLGKESKDVEIEHFIELMKNCKDLGIKTICYNWMPVWGWFRSRDNMVLPGGATVTEFDASVIPTKPISDVGIVTEDELWTNLEYFLKKVVPYAEEYDIQLAIHPDDPPVNNIGGISRILTSKAAMQQVIDMVPSEVNGITMCQGCFAAMGEDVVESIKHFGSQNKIFFAHFRDINGVPTKFNEEFHHTGKTNMYLAMKAYYESDVHCVIRPDHSPTMTDDKAEEQGYGLNGNLFAAGYMVGLMQSIQNEMGITKLKI